MKKIKNITKKKNTSNIKKTCISDSFKEFIAQTTVENLK